MSDTDQNAYSFANGEGALNGETFFAIPGRDDTLKFSKFKAELHGVTAFGGEENALDINNGSQIEVVGQVPTRLIGGKQCPLVVKGGSSLKTIGEAYISIDPDENYPTQYDIEVDGWSDQSSEPSTVEITVVHEHHGENCDRPVRVVFGRFRRPKIKGHVRIMWARTIRLHAYNIFKGAVRFVLRYPRGVQGPSWL